MYVCSIALKNTYSVLVVQGKLFVQSPLRVKSATAKGKKTNCKKRKIHIQTAQTILPEINFKMQLALNNFTKQK